jgi:hypothetical protein
MAMSLDGASGFLIVVASCDGHACYQGSHMTPIRQLLACRRGAGGSRRALGRQLRRGHIG